MLHFKCAEMHSSDEGSKLVKWMQQFMNKTKTAQEGQGPPMQYGQHRGDFSCSDD